MGPSIRETPLTFSPFEYPCSKRIPLPKVGQEVDGPDFLEVFKGRRSVKSLGECSLEQLSRILYHAAKPFTIDRDDYGVAVYRSAAPSAGGRHPIDILVGLPDAATGGRRLYLYQPLSHALGLLDIADDLQQEFYCDIDKTLALGESVLVWFSIQYMRTASKYTDYESLIWRDAGAQLCCIQQAAKYCGLDSCPIGYLAEETFGRLFDNDSLMSGGGLIIGQKK